jgi:hypothetical protein
MVRIVGEKPALDTLHDDAAYVGSSVGVFKVPMEEYQKSITPR